MATVVFTMLFAPSYSRALSDANYEFLKKESSEFTEADNQLRSVWKQVTKNLNDNEKKELLASQRNWIKKDWDEEAKKLMAQDGLSIDKAYTAAINNRISYLQTYTNKTTADTADTIPPVTASTDKNTVEVQAEGTGATKMEALKSAWMEAVRKGVGMFMKSKTHVIDDSVTEEIAMHSRGQVNSYQVLEENKNDGVYNIIIKAKIDRDILEEAVTSSKSQKLQFDGSNIAAELETTKEKNTSAQTVLPDINEILNLEKFIDYKASIKTLTDRNTKEKFICVLHLLKINLKNYKIEADELEKNILRIANSKFEIIPRHEEYAKNYIKMLKTPLDILIKQVWSYFESDNSKIIINKRSKFIKIFDNINEDSTLYNITKHQIDNRKFKEFICFFKNSSQNQCYKLKEDINKNIFLQNRRKWNYKVKFITEKVNSDFDSSLAVNEAYFVFPSILTEGQLSGSVRGTIIQPEITVFGSGGAGHWIGAGGVIACVQALNLDSDELLNIKNLTAKYEITRQ